MEEYNHNFWKGVLAGALGVFFILGVLTQAGILPVFYGSGLLRDRDTVKKLETLSEAIDTYYLDPVEPEDLKNGMYDGLLSSLEDPYSRYYTPEEYAAESDVNAGAYVGIGVVIQQTEEGVEIVSCYEGAAADLAGVKAGDIILAIDGEDMTQEDSSQVVERIRGQGKERVTLTLKREGEPDPLELTVEITDVTIPAVSGRMLKDHVGYIQISEFSGSAPEQYDKKFAELEEQGMDRLIVDLRDDPGGLLDSVCEILENILPQGLIVYTEDKNGDRTERTCSGEHTLPIPLVVLVNENTASASEIFAGAVQDYEIGTIVGTTTFGKGIVQSIMALDDGSAVKLTVANYYTPKGQNIHKKGITPDIIVEEDASSVKSGESTSENTLEDPDEEDSQLQEAIRIILEK